MRWSGVQNSCDIFWTFVLQLLMIISMSLGGINPLYTVYRLRKQPGSNWSLWGNPKNLGINDIIPFCNLSPTGELSKISSLRIIRTSPYPNKQSSSNALLSLLNWPGFATLRCLEKVPKPILPNGGVMVMNPMVLWSKITKKTNPSWWSFFEENFIMIQLQ